MTLPNFSFEKKFWKRYKFIAGVDEVGRGAFAGPVVAGCVVFDKNTKIPKDIKINDSKKLSSKKREMADKWIKENSLTWGIGETSVAEINSKGMAKAACSAFRRAIAKANMRLHGRVEFLLVDAFYIPYVRNLPVSQKSPKKRRQLAIINGDEKSVSIAAASIIAKVYRDNLMINLDKRSKYRRYGWENNKGYGTVVHRKAITKYGITRYHRKQFVKNYL
jgi:ribonuclease HII